MVVSLRAILLFSVVCGGLYPLLVTALAWPLRQDPNVLIGRPMAGARYFQPRPSACGYDAMASAASNLGPSRHERAGASGSGLDPHITPEDARRQATAVARARQIDVAAVERAIDEVMEGPTFGFLGAARVNVLLLNRHLDDTRP